ncbi:MAG: Lrp/AsnC ligand binding domain-containing protein [Thermoplasmatota archaeon]
MVIGFILIVTEPNKEKFVYQKLQKLKRVVEVHMLFGEYDIIVKADARNYTDLGRFVLKEIRPIRGVLDTETLTGVEFL